MTLNKGTLWAEVREMTNGKIKEIRDDYSPVPATTA
jgi:hypothetical protein